jgi:pimeloyl-ACP methyl ester carboxylesterase/DNA-binding CsgD family transcriptional regulator
MTTDLADNRTVEQRIESTRLGDGTRIAFAVAGEGPVLLYVPGWLTHLELSWALPAERALYEALADGRTVVRYDQPGCGLSGRSEQPYSMALELETLDAVAAAVGGGPFDVVGTSLGAVVAARWAGDHPGSVNRLALYGGWVTGSAVASPEVQAHVLGLIEQHWGLGSDVLADIFAPDATAPERAALTAFQRQAADPLTARDMLALCYEVDIAADLSRVAAPTLVLHRDRDRAAPLEQGRRLAEGIPDATFALLDGRSHMPYIGDTRGLVVAVREFLGLPTQSPWQAPVLTPRQLQVAALVTEGLTNRDIAERLSITERSAESHVERIRWRLGFRSRAQIAAWYVAIIGAAG